MLYPGQHGRSLISEDFNQLCVDNHVEATVQAYPNPGSMSGSMRVITFRNFNNTTVKVIQSNGNTSYIPAAGTIQIMMMPDEPFPSLERIE